MPKNEFSRLGRAALLISLCVGSVACEAAPAANASARRQAPQIPRVAQAQMGATDEIAVRDEIANQTWALLEMRDFAGVERLVKTYRDRRERTPSGSFKVTLAHDTIEDFLQEGGRAPCGEQRQAYVEDWLRAAPQSPPAIIAYARDFVLQALCIRGLEAPDKVDPKVMPTVRAKLQIAADALQDNKAAGAEDPHWYVLMEEIAAYQRWDEPKFEALHAEAVSKFGWNYAIYTWAGRYYLPRWGGSIEAFDQFARRSAERTRATDGMGLYVRLYWTAMWENELYHDLKHYSRADLGLLRTSMHDVAARYPTPWNYNIFAWISCRNEMFAEAKTYTDKITGPAGYPPWPTPAMFEACKYMADRARPSV
jgi:hypothetical protein